MGGQEDNSDDLTQPSLIPAISGVPLADLNTGQLHMGPSDYGAKLISGISSGLLFSGDARNFIVCLCFFSQSVFV